MYSSCHEIVCDSHLCKADQAASWAPAHATDGRYCLGLRDLDGGNPQGQCATGGRRGARGHAYGLGLSSSARAPRLTESNQPARSPDYVAFCIVGDPEVIASLIQLRSRFGPLTRTALQRSALPCLQRQPHRKFLESMTVRHRGEASFSEFAEFLAGECYYTPVRPRYSSHASSRRAILARGH